MKQQLLNRLLIFLFLIMPIAMLAEKKETNTNTVVKIETTLGNLKILLYDETPLHRDNFIKLSKEKYYEGLLFHRVIQDFMAQAGDPDSRNAEPTKRLGTGGPGYTIPAEIIFPKYIHKRGALAAARTSDMINPDRASSGSQFYIVQGVTLTDAQIDTFEMNLTTMLKQNLFKQILSQSTETITQLQKEGKIDDAEQLKNSIYKDAEKAVSEMKPFTYSDEQRRIYKMFGGTPHLDGQYTVFGEVIDGFSVLEEILNAKTLSGDRPEKNITILKIKVLKK